MPPVGKQWTDVHRARHGILGSKIDKGIQTAIQFAWLIRQHKRLLTLTDAHEILQTIDDVGDVIEEWEKARLGCDVIYVLGIQEKLGAGLTELFLLGERLGLFIQGIIAQLSRLRHPPALASSAQNTKGKEDAPQTEKRKHSGDDHEVLASKKPRFVHTNPIHVLSQEERTARLIQDVKDELRAKARLGNKVKPREPVRPVPPKTEKTARLIPPSQILWFTDETPSPAASQMGQGETNIFLQQKRIGMDFLQNIQKPAKFRQEMLRWRRVVDTCIKYEDWTDAETPQAMYILLRKRVTDITRLFYGNTQAIYDTPLRVRGTTVIAQPVAEAVSAAQIMSLIVKHFLEGPAFAMTVKDVQKIVKDEQKICKDPKLTSITQHEALLSYRRAYITAAHDAPNFAAHRKQRIEALAATIQRSMRLHQPLVVTQSTALMSLLTSAIKSVCLLAYDWAVITKTSAYKWMLYQFPTGDPILLDWVSVVGGLDGNVCRGEDRGCIAALTMFPALFRSRIVPEQAMIMRERAWIVAERLWEMPSRDANDQQG